LTQSETYFRFAIRTVFILIWFRNPQSAIRNSHGVNMFEQPVGKVEKDRSRLIMLLSGGAVVLVVALVILFSSVASQDAKVEMARPGSQEFDDYSRFVSVTIKSKVTGERLGVKYARIACTVRNDGDRVLTGIQVRGMMMGFNSEVLKERVVSPVPNRREGRDTLEPHQSFDMDLNVEPIPDPTQIMDMIVEIYALKVR
jgi:hypothetical protein